MKANKVTVLKAYIETPEEAKFQLENVMSDDNLKPEDLTMDYLITEVKWTIERMEMDMVDHEDLYEFSRKQKELCYAWLKKYNKYSGDGKPKGVEI
jgi:hypothetical protein